MRVSCIQLDMALGAVDENYEKAERLIRQTVRQQHSDVVVLPETWSTGYFPREDIQKYCEHDCGRSQAVSYTHLDVYKRQAQERDTELRQNPYRAL